jgi:hypothetical protein
VTAGEANDDRADFIDQARWLLDWHNKRAEAFTSRAVALLGFVGAILALLLQGVGLKGIDPSGWTWFWLVSSAIGLLAAALFAILTILPGGVQMPGVAELRRQWQQYAAEPVGGSAKSQFAEDLLLSSNLAQPSPLTDALTEADKRAKRFKVSITAMLVAFVLLAGLLFNILLNAQGR